MGQGQDQSSRAWPLRWVGVLQPSHSPHSHVPTMGGFIIYQMKANPIQSLYRFIKCLLCAGHHAGACGGCTDANLPSGRSTGRR